jgi:polyhydroxyalkanoate synthesis regulator phasin
MAKKNKLKEVTTRIGTALGKADKEAHRRARQIAAAGKVTKAELEEIAKHVEGLKKQLAKTTQKLKKVLSS